MPIRWKRGKNPYLHNSFGVLGVGPNTPINIIVATADQLKKKVRAGSPPKLGGEPLSTHQIDDARNCLLNDKMRAAELLLAHPDIKQDRRKLRGAAKKLQETAVVPVAHDPQPLSHPTGIFWFVPQPGPEATAWPPLKDFHLVEPGDPADLELDIVFDV